MTAVLGSFALAVGLVASLVATGLWVRASRPSAAPDAGALARQATWLVLVGAVLAVVALEIALVGNDFSIRYVAENSSRETPLVYRVTALWSALDGSLLLWLLVLAGYAVLVARSRHAWPSAVVNAVAAAFFVMALVGSQPFSRSLPAPADGAGPNPLLADHPAMLVHPPLLYLGYVGLVVPFAYAIAALVTRDAGQAWLRTTRRWLMLAWMCLTAGILMGAWWSYAVLGWGGYWAWDPVENASLLPWLTATALLHSALVQRRGRTLVPWNVGLAAASFLLVCAGTFLTRSGVVASVHAFTQSAMGPLLLGFLGLCSAVVVGLLIWRSDLLAAGTGGGTDGGTDGGSDRPRPAAASTTSTLSRQNGLLLNNVLLVGMAVVVLLATLAPAVIRALRGAEISVGAPYFDRLAVPAALLLLVLMVVGPTARWDGEDARSLLRRAALPAAVGGVVVAALGLSGARGLEAVLTIGLAAAVVTASLRAVAGVGRRSLLRRHRLVGAHVAHLGLAVAAAGIAASSAWTTTTQATVDTGGTLALGSHAVRLDRVTRAAGDGRMTTSAQLTLLHDGRATGSGRPALRFYTGRDMTVTLPSVTSRLDGDVYVTLLSVAQDGSSATLRLAVEPLVGLLWAGGALVVLGGALAAVPLRRPVRRKAMTPAREPSHQPTDGPTDEPTREPADAPSPQPVPALAVADEAVP